MEKIKILCLGNSSTDTVAQTNLVAGQYLTVVNGLLTEQSTDIQPGCYYTDIGTISVDYLMLVCKRFNLIVLLDQDPLSYVHADSFYQSMNICLFLKHQQQVIIQSDRSWCYIVTYLRPTDSDSSIIKVKNNQDLYQQVMVNNLTKRNVVLQLSHSDNFYNFTNYTNEIVQKCRSSASKFVMFRGDPHEEDPKLHYQLTKFLVQFPEFVLLTTDVFTANLNSNLEKIILQHWSNLYE